MRSPLPWSVLACFGAVLLCPPTTRAASTFSESFTTTTYKDAANTTALWDTGTGQLKLHPFAPTPVGGYDTSGVTYDVAVAGDLAFQIDRDTGLKIVNITNPASPTLVGSYNTPGTAFGVAVAGDLVFVADGLSGLQIIDITNPASPTLVATYDTPGTAYSVAIAGDLAFVADEGAGLQIINVLTPAAPVLVGSYDTPGTAWEVAVAGDLAFVADGSAGLQIVDILAPTSPTLVGTYNTPGSALGLAVAGDLAFVADNFSGLQIIDITNPWTPALVGNYNTSGAAYGVTVAGDLAFVADYTAGLRIINIANPANPTGAGGYDTSGQSYRVAVAGDLAFVADYGWGVSIFRIGYPVASPALVGASGTPSSDPKIAVAGDRAFVAGGSSGLQIFDITNPASPTPVGSYDTPEYAYDVAVAGDLAFVADDISGLQIINITNPASPTLVGAYDTPGMAWGVAVAGDLAFVADAYSGLQIINIINPAAPTLVGSYDTPGAALGVAVAGDLAFVADAGSGLQIFNITNPASPTLVGTYDTPGNARGVAVAGDLAFVADDVAGLQIISIRYPSTPTLVGSYDTPGNAYSVAVTGDLACVADYLFGLQVINITNPASPTLVGACDTPGQAAGIAVAGELAFMADGTSGLQVIQVLQHEVDPNRNAGRSLAVDGGSDTILRARLSSTQTAGVSWELSADAGADWQAITPDNAWNPLAVSGNDLQWRSTHAWSPGVNPTVSDLQLEWLNEFARVATITDVPGDQGGWVRVNFSRSGRDFADEPSLPIANYGIWRRVDDLALAAALASAPRRSTAIAGEIGEAFGGLPLQEHGARVFVRSAPGSLAAPLPAGTWELVQNVPALQQDTYLAALPTFADSMPTGSNEMVLVVTAHTTSPSVWYVSPPDSGYSVDNIAPGVPQGLAAIHSQAGVTLDWDPATDQDFQYFRVYRDSTPGFVPGPSTLVHETAGTSWQDNPANPAAIYYKLTALDHAGNESEATTPYAVSGVTDGAPLPTAFALRPNLPNPFRAGTQIRFDLAMESPVTLELFDISGRLVRTLVQDRLPAGAHSVAWDGIDGPGRKAPAGVYLYRLRAGSFESTRRMILVK